MESTQVTDILHCLNQTKVWLTWPFQTRPSLFQTGVIRNPSNSNIFFLANEWCFIPGWLKQTTQLNQLVIKCLFQLSKNHYNVRAWVSVSGKDFEKKTAGVVSWSGVVMFGITQWFYITFGDMHCKLYTQMVHRTNALNSHLTSEWSNFSQTVSALIGGLKSKWTYNCLNPCVMRHSFFVKKL